MERSSDCEFSWASAQGLSIFFMEYINFFIAIVDLSAINQIVGVELLTTMRLHRH